MPILPVAPSIHPRTPPKAAESPPNRDEMRCPAPSINVRAHARPLRPPENAALMDKNQLVGTLQNFAKTNPGEDARLLTHDTGPLYTAHSLGLKVEKIPDSWLLRPENDEHQKKIHILESELRRLKRSEPSFEVRFIDATGNETERFDGQMRWFEALSDRQVHELVDQLRQRFPMAATPRATTESPGLELAALTNLSASLFGHPDPEEVAKYREQDYPQWLDTCQDILANFHYLLQWEVPALRFAFAVRNSGIRPAEDALVTLTVKGSLRIMPPRESVEPVPLRLPGPPKPPQGNLDRLANLHDRSALAAFRTPDLHFDGPPLLRDRNKFYARGSPPTAPTDSFSLICDQWRHSDTEEQFTGEIHLSRPDAQGALQLDIQANNLSDSITMSIPVHIGTSRLNSFMRAQELVRNMLKDKLPDD